MVFYWVENEGEFFKEYLGSKEDFLNSDIIWKSALFEDSTRLAKIDGEIMDMMKWKNMRHIDNDQEWRELLLFQLTLELNKFNGVKHGKRHFGN